MQSNADEARAVLAVWTDAAEATDADFNEWYNREHVNERADVPGFLSGRRYRALTGRPRYMALYDTIGADVLSSPTYRAALDNPSEWTQRVMPGFRNLTRAVLDIRARVGVGYGAVAASFRPPPGKKPSDAMAEWLAGTALPEILERPGVTGASFLTAGSPAPATNSTEGRLRPGADESVEWAVIVEGTEPDMVRAACNAILPRGAFANRGAPRVKRGQYRLLYGNDSLRKDYRGPA